MKTNPKCVHDDMCSSIADARGLSFSCNHCRYYLPDSIKDCLRTLAVMINCENCDLFISRIESCSSPRPTREECLEKLIAYAIKEYIIEHLTPEEK